LEITTEIAALDPRRRRLEVVERKGVGHPDSLCDAAAEAFSLALCRHYLDTVGAILHHNVDKALLVGGRTRVAFGGGAWLAPIRLTLAGRATTRIGDDEVPVEEIGREAARAALAVVRHLDPLQVETRIAVQPGAAELREVFERPARDVPRANDTSFGTGFAPFSPTESLALEIDRQIAARRAEDLEGPLGEDVKVMLVRQDDTLRVTVACALLAGRVADAAAYGRAVEDVRARAAAAARAAGFASAQVDVNAADAASGSYYLTLSGTSAECGDDGQVGRGNRSSGLITPMRPMTLEAYAGKNPRTHVGKLLSVAAQRIAERAAALDGVRGAECVLVSQIGAPVDEPRGAGVRLDAPEEAAAVHAKELSEIVEGEVAHIPHLWREIVGP